MGQKTLIFIPTYKEAENINLIHEAIKKTNISHDLLFIDDNSPDGTSQLIKNLQKDNQNLFLIERKGKEGIGSAHKVGIQYAYDNGYDLLITMDCDFTHNPDEIQNLIDLSKQHPVVVTNRHKKKNSLSDWSLFRKSLTILGYFLTTQLLNVKEDATGAFRAYDLHKINRNIFNLVQSNGYSFFFESLFILKQNNLTVGEVLIDLPSRTYGHSKMKWSDAVHSVTFLFKLSLNRILNPHLFAYTAPIAESCFNPQLIDKQDWDSYWSKKKKKSSFIYDSIAAFYRLFIIKPNLNRYISKYFTGKDVILHAGCGSGQVDSDLSSSFQIKALDISSEALKIYKKVNKIDDSKIIHGSILNIPIENNSISGVYNLGVMEHFELGEIDKIMSEFYRILKKDGKIILFWPPEHGSSVIFLKMVHWVMKHIFGSKTKLHPDEVSRIHSKNEARQILESNGFTLKEYYFGLRDFYTYSVVVGVKD